MRKKVEDKIRSIYLEKLA